MQAHCKHVWRRDDRRIFANEALLADGWASRRAHSSSTTATIAGRRDETLHRDRRRAPCDRHSGDAQPAQPRLPARHGRPRRNARTAADSFWTWREVMYRFALTMTPEQVEAVAAQLYVEMLEAGFTRVGEFHYLHHDRDGTPYADIAEMAERIAAAASATGIGADAAAGLLRAFRLRRCRTRCRPAPFHQRSRPLRAPARGKPRARSPGSTAPWSASRRTACAP